MSRWAGCAAGRPVAPAALRSGHGSASTGSWSSPAEAPASGRRWRGGGGGRRPPRGGRRSRRRRGPSRWRRPSAGPRRCSTSATRRPWWTWCARRSRPTGPIDLFCSNAGFVTQGGVEESDEVLQALWEVHVLAHVHAARAVLPSMIAQGEGYLLNTASAAGLLTQVGSMGYTITKHAAVALAEWLAITHHHQGIRVSVLCPQAVRTNITANSPDARVADPSVDDPLGVAVRRRGARGRRRGPAVPRGDRRRALLGAPAPRGRHLRGAEGRRHRPVAGRACAATRTASTATARCPATGWCRGT